MADQGFLTGGITAQGLGLMRLRDEGWGDEDRDPAALVAAAIDGGVTVLDTAEMYGNEEVVGRAIGDRRDRVTLCSKFGVYWGSSGNPDDWSVRADPETVRRAAEGSLRRLGVETIDLYYLHHRSDETPIEETVAAMAQLREAGKIRGLGLSNVTLDDIRRAHAVHPIQAVQEQWSPVQREVETMSATLAELGITLVAHSPMNHGNLPATGGDVLNRLATSYGLNPHQLALAWVHNRARRAEHPVIPLPGTTRISHLRANIATGSVVLDDETVAALDALGV